MDLHYSDGIAAARTTLALHANPAALQRRLPRGWEPAPSAGQDQRGTWRRGANLLVPFHQVYAVKNPPGQPAGMPQASYLAFVSQARDQPTGEFATGLSPEVRQKRGRAARRWRPQRSNEGSVRWR